MHGVKRQRPGQRDPEDVRRAKAAKEQAKTEEYTGLRAQLASLKARADYSNEALDLTTRILEKNPEFQSGWAYRRRTLLKGLIPERNEQDAQKLLEQDLDLTVFCLKRNPKEYAVWEHRKWVLQTMPDPDWRFELKTAEGMLERDARNFHAWDYRRYIINCLGRAPAPPSYSTRKRPVPTTSSELAFTSAKIAASFSNFSAWHYRSKLLAKLWEESAQGPSDPQRIQRIDQEFDLVKQALYTDPDDQSAWIYHRWLVGKGEEQLLRREIAVIEELLELEPESKWCLDSLVFYGRRLAALVNEDKLHDTCRDRLSKLEHIDPLRKNRHILDIDRNPAVRTLRFHACLLVFAPFAIMAPPRLENPYEVQQTALLSRIIGNVEKLNEAILELTKSLGEVNSHNSQMDELAEMWGAYSRNVTFNLESHNELHEPV